MYFCANTGGLHSSGAGKGHPHNRGSEGSRRHDARNPRSGPCICVRVVCACSLCVFIHVRGVLTCGEVIHHVAVLQEKDALLIKYARDGCTGGVLMALKAGANVNHKDSVWECVSTLRVYVYRG